MNRYAASLFALLIPLSHAQEFGPGNQSVDTFLQFDSDRDGAVSRIEARESPSLRTTFEQIDVNRDGRITADEMSGYGPYAYPGGSQSASTFLQFDADRDGKVSRIEARASPSLHANFFRLDLNRDGEISTAEMPGYPFALSAGNQSASTFLQFDGDRDGAVSRVEARESYSLSANFIRLDRNQDGSITADEMTAHHHPFAGALARYGVAPSGAQSASTFLQFDANRDGRVSRIEAQASPSLRVYFDRLDANEDGAISVNEIGG